MIIASALFAGSSAISKLLVVKYPVGEILCDHDLLGWSQAVDLDAIESHDQFLGLAERDLVRRRSRAASLPDSFADVERHASRGPSHLTLQVGFSTLERGDDPADASVQIQGAAVNVEQVQVVSPNSIHRLSSDLGPTL